MHIQIWWVLLIAVVLIIRTLLHRYKYSFSRGTFRFMWLQYILGGCGLPLAFVVLGTVLVFTQDSERPLPKKIETWLTVLVLLGYFLARRISADIFIAGLYTVAVTFSLGTALIVKRLVTQSVERR